MCLGMIHHMSSTYDTISKLTKFSNKISIINTMVIPDLENDKKLIEPFVNTKDVIYQDDSYNAVVSGTYDPNNDSHKFTTNYTNVGKITGRDTKIGKEIRDSF